MSIWSRRPMLELDSTARKVSEQYQLLTTLYRNSKHSGDCFFSMGNFPTFETRKWFCIFTTKISWFTLPSFFSCFSMDFLARVFTMISTWLSTTFSSLPGRSSPEQFSSRTFLLRTLETWLTPVLRRPTICCTTLVRKTSFLRTNTSAIGWSVPLPHRLLFFLFCFTL